jgi:hypothetical protein
MTQFATDPEVIVTLSSNGTVSDVPVPDGLQVCVEVLTQGDAEVSTD